VLRTVGVGFGIENRVALARFGRDRCQDDQAKFDLAVVAGSVRTQQATRLTIAAVDRYCCHFGCTSQAPEQPKCQLPPRGRAVPATELPVRRRCPVGSRTIGVVALNEHRQALACEVRENGRGDRAKLESVK
jgi:hypothetical protein